MSESNLLRIYGTYVRILSESNGWTQRTILTVYTVLINNLHCACPSVTFHSRGQLQPYRPPSTSLTMTICGISLWESPHKNYQILIFSFFKQLGSAYSIYSEYHSFQVIKDVRDEIDTTTKMPVDKKYFDGIIFSLSLSFALLLHYILDEAFYNNLLWEIQF